MLRTRTGLVGLAALLALAGLQALAEQPAQPLPALNLMLFAGPQAKNRSGELEALLGNSNHDHSSETVNIELANSVWRRMHENALDFARRRAHEARPVVERLVRAANVSFSCAQSLESLLQRLGQLDKWAVQMYNSFGEFPPAGLFEGTFHSMGSYHQCVEVAPNELIGRAQYCTFKFQPVIPKRPRYHNILASIEGLANFTSSDDAFHELAQRAQYYYYTKLRLATCMPNKCDKSDLESLGKQVALNTYLQYSGVSCLEKKEPFNPDGAQIFALTILISFASISFLGTLVHLLNVRQYFESGSKASREASYSSSSSSSASSTTSSSSSAKHLDLNHNENFNGDAINNNNNNNNNNNTISSHDIQRQQRKLLAAAAVAAQQASKTAILPAPIIEIDDARSARGERSRALRTIDTLLHFSIIKNGRKLFDTSTSRAARPERSDGLSESGSTSERGAAGQPRSNDISCVHGLRFWTISWIIFGHTMQYTEWAGFARAYQVEENITSFILHPLLNATFSVDTFFLISGLLTTYVTWSMTRGQYRRLNKFAFLISRYLRLTPQVMLVILFFIVFPLMGDGPYWRGLIQKESDNCRRNWWINALYLQAFVRNDEICNLVTWWLSIEMFYHFVSLLVIIALLQGARRGILTTIAIGSGFTAVSCFIHYANHYPPNMLPTLLQRYEIWHSIVLKYFWTPFPHAAAYFVGLFVGYALHTQCVGRLTRFQVKMGWWIFAACYLGILFGTYGWNKNAPYSRITSTIYYNTSQVLWAMATGWAILACALGHGGWLNRFLSSSAFVPLGRATYMTYLSHMLIVQAYPAKMSTLIEPSYIIFLYIAISNIFLAYVLGIALTLIYESPILYVQKMIVARMSRKMIEEEPNEMNEQEKSVRVNLFEKPKQVPSIQEAAPL